MSSAESKFAPVPGYSRSAIEEAGVELRRWWLSDDGTVDDATLNAFHAMITFREAFQLPLKKTVMGLRSMVRSECPELKQPDARVPVAQRLKRSEQIIRQRLPSSARDRDPGRKVDRDPAP